MSGFRSPPPSGSDSLAALAEVARFLRDPVAVGEHLEKVEAATAKHNEAAQAAQDALAQAAKLQQSAMAAAAEVERRHAAVTAGELDLHQRQAALEAKEREHADKAQQLAADRVAFERASSEVAAAHGVRDADIAARHAAADRTLAAANSAIAEAQKTQEAANDAKTVADRQRAEATAMLARAQKILAAAS